LFGSGLQAIEASLCEDAGRKLTEVVLDAPFKAGASMTTAGIKPALPAVTVIVSLSEPVSGGLAESVAVTVRV
jgi:hypothetical protein